MLSVVLGDPIFLNVQLGSGSVGKYVLATLRDINGVIFGSAVLLTDQGGGFYSDKTVPMPNKPLVVATYRVYDDAGYSVISAENQDSIDIYTLESVAEIFAASGDSLRGELSQVFSEITGTIQNAPQIGGGLNDSSSGLTGTIAALGITGDISDQKLTGSLTKGA